MTARRQLLGYALMLVVLLVLVIGDPAGAQPTQIDDMIEGPALQGDDEPTIAERYPVTSYRYPFHGEGLSVGARSNELLDQTLNAIASLLILAAGLLAQAASTVVQWAFDTSTTAWLLDGVEATASALGESLYGQAVLVMVFIGILWLAWHGLAQRRATTALQGAVWMIAILAIGVAFFAQPRWFIETPHQLTTELSAGMFGAVATVGTDTDHGSYHGDQPPTFTGSAAVNAQRRLEDQLWRVMVYEPWRTSTFANDQLADEFAEPLLADRSEDNVADIYDAIREQNEADAEFFAGREPLDRLIASVLTLLAALPIAVTMIVLGAALIVLQFAFVILSLLAPIFLLLGLHPGGGRNAMLRWLDMWLGTLVKRVAITALISVLVALFAFAASNLTQQGWYLTVLLTTLVCVAALIYRKTITELIASAAGSIGSGAEGEREHRARAHPGRTTARATAQTTRAVKYLGIGALAAKTGRALRQPPDDPAREADQSGTTPTGRRRGDNRGQPRPASEPNHTRAPEPHRPDGSRQAGPPTDRQPHHVGVPTTRPSRHADDEPSGPRPVHEEAGSAPETNDEDTGARPSAGSSDRRQDANRTPEPAPRQPAREGRPLATPAHQARELRAVGPTKPEQTSRARRSNVGERETGTGRRTPTDEPPVRESDDRQAAAVCGRAPSDQPDEHQRDGGERPTPRRASRTGH